MHASGAGTSWPIMMGSDGTTASTAGMGGFYLAFDGTGYFRYTSAAGGGTGINLNFPGNAFPKSQWNHVVSCRVAGDMYAFINGALVGQSKQQGVSLRTDINTNGIMIPWTGGGDGGDMTTGGSSNFAPDGDTDASGHLGYKGGWQGSILWVDSTNLTVTNTITNDSATPIAGWDGVWT